MTPAQITTTLAEARALLLNAAGERVGGCASDANRRALVAIVEQLIDDKPDLTRPSYVGHKALVWMPCCSLDDPCERHEEKT